MSFRFIVPGEPSFQILEEAGAKWRVLTDDKDANGVMAWRDRPIRGVYVFEEEGNAHFKLNSAASPDDVALAQELAIRHAKARGVPIEAEQPPDNPDPTWIAPEPPEGFSEHACLYTPEQLAAWPSDWHASHAMSALSFMARFIKEQGIVTLSGPHRRTWLGSRMFLGSTEGITTDRAMLEALFKALIAAQAEDVATLPLKHRFLFSTGFSTGFWRRLFGLGMPIPDASMWSPPPIETLLPPIAYEGDISQHNRAKREATYTVATPGESYLLPVSDYVALGPPRDGAWACARFSSFLQALGPRGSWLDEGTYKVTAPEGDGWERLLEKLAPEIVVSLPHEEQLLGTVQELVTTLASAHKSKKPDGWGA